MEKLIERLKNYNEKTKIELERDLEIQGESQRIRLVTKRDNNLYYWLKEQSEQSGLTIKQVKERLDHGLDTSGDVSPKFVQHGHNSSMV